MDHEAAEAEAEADEDAWMAALAAANARAAEPAPEPEPETDREIEAAAAPEPEIEPDVPAAPVELSAALEAWLEPVTEELVGGVGADEPEEPSVIVEPALAVVPAPAPEAEASEPELEQEREREGERERERERETPAEIEELLALLRSGRLLLCAGPRLVAGRPTCVELIGRLLSALPEDETRDVWPVLERHPLAAAGFVRRRLGDSFQHALAEAVGGLELPLALRRLGALPFRAVVTTSYDDVLEQAFALEGRELRVYTPREASALRQDGKLPFVLKALGDARRADSLVFTTGELQALLADAEFRAATHDLFRARSFLFVGFQRGDLDLQILLERVLAGAPAGEGEHFALLPGLSAIEREELSAAWKIRVLDEQSLDGLADALHDAFRAAAPAPLPEPDDADGWLALLADDPHRKDAIAELDRLFGELHEAGGYDALAELAIGRAAVEPDATHRAELLLKVARIFEHEAEDPARALTLLLAACKEAPALATWHDLERLADASDAWHEVEAELDEVAAELPLAVRLALHKRLAHWALYAEALDTRAAQAEPADARAFKLEAAALFAGPLGDRATAIARYEALLSGAPHDLAVLRALEKLYEADSRHSAFLANLQRQAEAVESDTERAALYRRLALAWEEEPEGAVRAEALWETVLTIEPQADDALRSLERLYGTERKWPELIEALRRHAQIAAPPVQAELFGRIGILYERELHDLDNALEAHRLAEAAYERPETLATLTRLYEQTGALDRALELYDRRARKSEDRTEQLEFMCRAAQLCGDLRDTPGAEKRFSRVLELDPQNAQAMTALADIYRQHGEFLRAAKLLVEAVPHTANRLQRTRLLASAGEMYDRVDDPHKAVALYLQTLAEDPEHLQATERAAELLWGMQRHEELVPVLEVLSRKQAPQEVLVERLTRLGRAAASIGYAEKAEKAFARAAELDPANLEAQRSLADHYLRNEAWGPALSALDRVFQHHIDKLPVGQHVELFSQMGRCELMLGAREAARELLARALELDPTHRPSLLAQMKLSEGAPKEVIAAKRALLSTASTDEQVVLLNEIGELHLALRDRAGATAAWREALQLRWDDHRLLHKCLDAYVEEGLWMEALEMLDRLIAVEREPQVRARYRLTAGLIWRDELQRGGAAIAHLRAALEDEPGLERAQGALEQQLATEGEHKELARFYRALLKRLGPESAGDADGKNHERLRVWTALGELCRDKLGDLESAAAALEVALALCGDGRDNLEQLKRLADLYVQAGPKYFEKSIAAHQAILKAEKRRVLSYRALKHLYIQTQQRDKSVLCSAVLELLQKGEPDDAKKLAAHKKRPFATARRAFGDDGWARVLHPDEDRVLDQLFAIVGPTVVAGQAKPQKAHGLNPKEAITDDDSHSYSKALRYVAATVDVPVPVAYARPEQREPVLYANSIEGRALQPVLLLGQTLVGERRNEREQVFELTRVMTHLRPERMLRLAMPHPDAIAQVIEAAMAIAAEAEGEPAGADAVGKIALGFKRALPQIELEQVAVIGQKLRVIGTRPEAAALRWLQATDLTGLRAGWVLTGDLELCARLVAADGHPPAALAPTQRLLELAWSTTTEDLFAARRLLGLV
jgi:tetratricopeptide (TPR) repeat protein